MASKKPELKEKKEINTYKSSVIIGGEGEKDGFISEYKNNYLDGKLGINLKNFHQDKKSMDTINNIRKSILILERVKMIIILVIILILNIILFWLKKEEVY